MIPTSSTLGYSPREQSNIEPQCPHLWQLERHRDVRLELLIGVDRRAILSYLAKAQAVLPLNVVVQPTRHRASIRVAVVGVVVEVDVDRSAVVEDAFRITRLSDHILRDYTCWPVNGYRPPSV